MEQHEPAVTPGDALEPGLQRLQGLEQAVVLGIRHQRRIQHVVGMGQAMKRLTPLRRLLRARMLAAPDR